MLDNHGARCSNHFRFYKSPFQEPKHECPPQYVITTGILRILGLILLAAAGLKVYGFDVDPIARTGVFSAPAFQFLVIAFELVLGSWLLSGKQQLGAWIVVM